ncbi:MAG: hypothetical protein JCHSAcid_06070 [uncultured Acidilobus sp. JCHS]|jgi:hypothetical protein|nr:MAG: hypothetical protein JCHSAcid_06070 [uncultured Acidilobus sp. JCHS]
MTFKSVLSFRRTAANGLRLDRQLREGDRPRY